MGNALVHPLSRWFEQLCSIGVPLEASEDFAGRMRAEQLRVVRRLTPMMMSSIILNAVILYFVFFGRTNTIALTVWAAVVVALALLGLRGWYLARGRSPKPTASMRSIKRATIAAATMALAWCYTDYLFVQQFGSTETLVVAGLKAGMMGAGAFALATVPLAAILFASILGIPSLISLVALGGGSLYGLALIFVGYIALLAAIVRSTFQVFVERQLAQAERARLAEDERLTMLAQENRSKRVDEMIREFDRAVAASLDSISKTADRLHGSAGESNERAALAGASTRSATARAEAACAAIETAAAACKRILTAIAGIVDRSRHSTEVGERAVQQVSHTVEAISSLTEAARRIEGVVDLIQSIAGRTNLLALNATIEAARAGEAGRGFAVVAGEVKQLAAQTARATEDISRHVAAIQATSGRTADAIASARGTIDMMSSIAAEVVRGVYEQASLVSGIAEDAAAAAVSARASVEDDVRAGEAAAAAQTVAGQAQDLALSLSRETRDLDGVVRNFLRQVRVA